MVLLRTMSLHAICILVVTLDLLHNIACLLSLNLLLLINVPRVLHDSASFSTSDGFHSELQNSGGLHNCEFHTW